MAGKIISSRLILRFEKKNVFSFLLFCSAYAYVYIFFDFFCHEIYLFNLKLIYFSIFNFLFLIFYFLFQIFYFILFCFILFYFVLFCLLFSEMRLCFWIKKIQRLGRKYFYFIFISIFMFFFLNYFCVYFYLFFYFCI